MKAKQSLYKRVTDQVIKAMDTSTGFQLPWHSNQGVPINAKTSNTYNGINTVLLWCRGAEESYPTNTWATYKQWQDLGAQVTKGEKGSSIVIYKPLTEPDVNESSDKQSDKNESRPKVLIKSATVFNASQVTGYDSTGIGEDAYQEDEIERLPDVEAFIQNSKAEIHVAGDRAYYTKSKDLIVMPERGLFTGTTTINPTEAYYSTLFHELTHWTGNHKRCDRDLTGRFGSESYAMEELVAELGAAFLCSELSVTSSPRQDHADYLATWIKVLKDDEKAIFWAAARASEAVTYLKSM